VGPGITMEFCESRSDNPIRLLSIYSSLRGKQEFLLIQSSNDLKKSYRQCALLWRNSQGRVQEIEGLKRHLNSPRLSLHLDGRKKAIEFWKAIGASVTFGYTRFAGP
jgi:hypothetical protein